MSETPESPASTTVQRRAWQPPQPDQGSPNSRSAWLVTFTDLVALLLAFFVMLFAMMTLDDQLWHRVQQSFSAQWIELAPLAEVRVPDEEQDTPTAELLPGVDLDYLATLMRRELPKHASLANARVDRQVGRLVIALPDRLLFAVNAVRPHQAAADALYALGGVLQNIPNRIEVVGHADPRPMPEDGELSNWELSLARGAAVADMLGRAGYTQPILIRGHGESRYDELSPLLGEETRLSLGRRTDIVILEDGGEAPR